MVTKLHIDFNQPLKQKDRLISFFSSRKTVAGFIILSIIIWMAPGLLGDKSEEKETDKPIQNEADNGLTNDAFTISMARTNDPDSATSQFFINLENNDFLNHTSKSSQGWGYAVFGKVTKGIEVVEKIGSVKTGTKGFYQDVPISNVIIEKVTVLNSNAKSKRN